MTAVQLGDDISAEYYEPKAACQEKQVSLAIPSLLQFLKADFEALEACLSPYPELFLVLSRHVCVPSRLAVIAS